MVSPSPSPTSAILVPIYLLVLAVFLIVRSLGNIVSNKRNQNLKITTWGQIVVIVSRNKSWFIKKYLLSCFLSLVTNIPLMIAVAVVGVLCIVGMFYIVLQQKRLRAPQYLPVDS